MSKTVVVTDHKGNVTTLKECKGAVVQDTLLYIHNTDGTTRAVFKTWAHVEIVEETIKGGKGGPIAVDEAQQTLPEPWYVRYNAALGAFLETLDKASAEVERNQIPCTDCGYVPILVFKNYGETFCFECYKKQNPKETVQW